MVVMSNTPINITGSLGPVIQQTQLMSNDQQNKQQIQMQQMKVQQAQQVHQQNIIQQVINNHLISLF